MDWSGLTMETEPILLETGERLHLIDANETEHETTLCGLDLTTRKHARASDEVAELYDTCQTCETRAEESERGTGSKPTAQYRAEVAMVLPDVDPRPENPELLRKREWKTIHDAVVNSVQRESVPDGQLMLYDLAYDTEENTIVVVTDFVEENEDGDYNVVYLRDVLGQNRVSDEPIWKAEPYVSLRNGVAVDKSEADGGDVRLYTVNEDRLDPPR